MVNKELLQIAAMGSGGILFALGGYKWKWLRRFVLPLVLGGIALLSGVLWWKALILTLGLIAALHLGYGQTKPYWWKFLVGCAFVAPTLALGFTIWQVITPIVWITLFALSNWKPLAKEFIWKICEFIIGSLIGITMAVLL